MANQDNIQEGFIKKAIRAVAGKYVANERATAHHRAAMKNIIKATDKGKTPEEVGAAMKSSTRNRKAERAYSRVNTGRALPKFGTRTEEYSPLTREIITVLESENPATNLKETVYAALSERVQDALNEYKKIVAESYFGQPTDLLDEDTDLQELSKKTLGSYIKKASHDITVKGAATREFANRAREDRKNDNFVGARKNSELSDKTFNRSWKRRTNMAKAVDRLTKD